jgi:ATP adenylyltransferase
MMNVEWNSEFPSAFSIQNSALGMDYLWSPWRLPYVTGTHGRTGCVFCAAVEDESSEDASLVVFRSRVSFIILNKYPYNSGHLLIVPYRHISSVKDATPDELSEMMALARLSEIALTEAYAPHGMNMGINLGKPAGAGILDHLHMHVVPRWNGDTNYMTVVGQTRVLPEELFVTSERLRPIFAGIAAKIGSAG